MRLLFVSPADLDAPRGGRAQLAQLHRDALAALTGESFAEQRLGGETAGLWQRARGWLDGATPTGVRATLAAIDAHEAQAVWLDGSNLGRIAQAVRRERPGVRLFTFCHNVEARFFLGALRRSRSVRAAGVVAGNYAAERLSTRHSDVLVTLSARDGALFRRLYGRGADALLPMAVPDRLGDVRRPAGSAAPDAPLLFVGGGFYANRDGIAWFAREVAPHVALTTAVVGQGMEAMATELAGVPNLRLIGPVDDLAPHYAAARVAIAPIFDGSGMKTKVAEALMFGKRVIGTAEAWSGYDALGTTAGWRCDDAAGFVAAIAEAGGADIPAFDAALRALYERHHSPEATRARLATILGLAVSGPAA